MNPVVKQKWLAALRGELERKYDQGKSSLRTMNDHYCCLGVLSDLYSQECGVPWERVSDHYVILGSDGYLPPAVVEWAGLTDDEIRRPGFSAQYSPDAPDVGKDVLAGEPDISKPERSLSYRNDRGDTFLQIAERIEKYL